MNENKDIFDDLLKSQLDDLTGEVSFDDWEAIESRLDAMEEKKRAPLWWFWLAGIVIVGAVSTVLYTQLKSPVSDEIATSYTPTEGTTKEPVVIKNNIPTEAPAEAEANNPNQRERGVVQQTSSVAKTNTPTYAAATATSTEISDTTTSDVVVSDINDDSKTLSRSNGNNNLPTKNRVDNEPGDSSSKGGRISGFTSVDSSIKVNNNDKTTPKGENGNSVKQAKWEVGIAASPTWASKIISPNGENSWRINPRYNSIAKSMESGGVSYRAGLYVNRYFGQIFYAGAGFNYNQAEENIAYDYIVTEFVTELEDFDELIISPRNPLLYDTVKQFGRNTYKFVEIPFRVGLNKPVLNDRLNLRLETGFKYIYLASLQGNKADVTNLELLSLKEVKDQYSLHNFGLTTSVGIFFNINKSMTWGMTPYYSWSLSSIRNKNEGIKDKPYTYGLNLNLQHKIWSK